jgi:Domain of unknown function (DUF5668)/Cell wall-active antibiotics response 4TMS YvqF
MSDSTCRHSGRLMTGFVVIGLGVLFTLDNFGLANAHQVLRWWPALLVLWGLMGLTGFGVCRTPVFGSAAVFVGSWLLLSEAGILHRDVWQLWPVLFIIFGITLIRGRSTVWRVGVIGRDREAAEKIREALERRRAARLGASVGQDAAVGAPPSGASATSGADGPGTFSLDAVMSNIVRKIAIQNLTRGAVVALMGGADVDLRSAVTAAGTATLEVNLVMGGLNLFVPEDWAVEFEGSPIMGNVDDQAKHPVGAPRSRLIISGVVLMSSIVIRN